LKIVEVTWMDAHSQDAWHEKLESSLRSCQTAGYLVLDTDDAIVIAGMVDLEPPVTYACAMTIPKSAIKKMRKIG